MGLLEEERTAAAFDLPVSFPLLAAGASVLVLDLSGVQLYADPEPDLFGDS
jgi:hypothetical protein